MGLNKVALIGNLGRDGELRYTQSGQAVMNLSVATNEFYKKDGEQVKHTEWHRCIVWGERAEKAAPLYTKGKQVYIEGRLRTRQWEDKDGVPRYTTEIMATNHQLLGPAPAGRPDSAPPVGDEDLPSAGDQFRAQENQASEDPNDDIPF